MPATITIDHANWLEAEQLVSSSGGTMELFDKHFREGRLTVGLDVVLPKEFSQADADAAAKKVVPALRNKIVKAFVDAFTEAFRELNSQNPRGPENAAKLIEAANKYGQGFMKSFRKELRFGVARAIGAKADDLQTSGDATFKKFKSTSEEFDVEAVELGGDLLDIKSALDKSGWQHCAVACDTSKALIAIDTKPISSGDAKLLKKAHSGGTASVAHGRYQGKGRRTDRHKFEFLKGDSSLPGNEKLTKTWLQRAIEDQVQRKMTVNVVFVSEFTADKKAATEKPKTGKETGKESAKETSDSAKPKGKESKK